MTIKIYRLTMGDGSTHYFKGINDLRDFAKELILDGHKTDTLISELGDDQKVVDFFTKDYREKLDVIVEVSKSDFI